MRRALGVTLIGAWAGLLAASTAAQNPQTFRAAVDIVTIDVTVLDRNRVPVRGLGIGDFTILEDGTPQPVVAFEAVTVPGSPRAGAAWTRDVAPDVVTNNSVDGRLVVILFDHSIRADWQGTARDVATAVVDGLGPGDLAAVIFTQSLGTPQNFTSDRGRLRHAITSRVIGTSLLDNSIESGQCPCGLCSLAAIQRVADALGGIHRRQKAIFFIGGAIAVNVVPNPTFKDCAQYTQPATAQMLQAIQRANVVVHAFDPAGLTSGYAVASTRQPTLHQPASLQVLAEETGGRAVINDNRPSAVVPEIFAESQTYYLLGFAASEPPRSRPFRPVTVRVNRPEVEVRARRGYYAPGATAAAPIAPPTPPVSPLYEAIQAPLALPELPLRVSVAPFAIAGKVEAALGIVLGLSPWQATGGQVDIVTSAFDTDGRAVGSREHRLEVPPSGDAHVYEVISRIDLRPGRYEIRIAAKDVAASRLGSVHTFVDVPDFSRSALALSGVMLETIPALRSTPREALAPLLAIRPTALRAFPAAVRARAFVRVYQGGAGATRAVAVRTRVVDDADNVVLAESTPLDPGRFGADRAADYFVELPIQRVIPGRYLLTIEAALGRSSVTREVRFSVTGG